MQITLEEKLNNFLSNNDFDEFLSYYYTHNDSFVEIYDCGQSVYEYIKEQVLLFLFILVDFI